jgi:hypothetical protein
MGEKKKWKEEEEKRKKKKFSVLERRIILWVFFLYMRWQIVIGGQKSPLLHPIRREVIPFCKYQ